MITSASTTIIEVFANGVAQLTQKVTGTSQMSEVWKLITQDKGPELTLESKYTYQPPKPNFPKLISCQACSFLLVKAKINLKLSLTLVWLTCIPGPQVHIQRIKS